VQLRRAVPRRAAFPVAAAEPASAPAALPKDLPQA
jgi:hypothetical protein